MTSFSYSKLSHELTQPYIFALIYNDSICILIDKNHILYRNVRRGQQQNVTANPNSFAYYVLLNGFVIKILSEIKKRK